MVCISVMSIVLQSFFIYFPLPSVGRYAGFRRPTSLRETSLDFRRSEDCTAFIFENGENLSIRKNAARRCSSSRSKRRCCRSRNSGHRCPNRCSGSQTLATRAADSPYNPYPFLLGGHPPNPPVSTSRRPPADGPARVRNDEVAVHATQATVARTVEQGRKR